MESGLRAFLQFDAEQITTYTLPIYKMHLYYILHGQIKNVIQQKNHLLFEYTQLFSACFHFFGMKKKIMKQAPVAKIFLGQIFLPTHCKKMNIF